MNDPVLEATGCRCVFPIRARRRISAPGVSTFAGGGTVEGDRGSYGVGVELGAFLSAAAAIEQRWQAQEEEWQRLQQELFVLYGK